MIVEDEKGILSMKGILSNTTGNRNRDVHISIRELKHIFGGPRGDGSKMLEYLYSLMITLVLKDFDSKPVLDKVVLGHIFKEYREQDVIGLPTDTDPDTAFHAKSPTADMRIDSDVDRKSVEEIREDAKKMIMWTLVGTMLAAKNKNCTQEDMNKTLVQLGQWWEKLA